MKKLIVFAVVLIASITYQSKAAEYYGEGAFYSELAPFGQWFELNDGMTVWQPDMVPANWAPYTMGRWEWTADGWYWDSDEPFGYITYHYGRWYNDDYYGWIWVPDTQWAPAWVEWRYDDDYVGWAPLSPYGVFTIGVGIHFTHEYHTPYGYWNFVTYDHFCDYNVYRYYAGPSYRYRIYNGTRFRNDYDYSHGRVINRGIGYDLVRERSGRPIKTREIIRVTDPTQLRNTDRSVIRTYEAPPQAITRNTGRDINIKRSDRRTSLEVSKINIGERNPVVRNGGNIERRDPVVTRPNETPRRDIQDQQNNQRQQQIDQQNRQRQDAQRPQQVEQQNRQRQEQIDQQNRQRQDAQRQQQVDQQNRQRQQQVDQQNRQRQQQQIQQRQNVEQQRQVQQRQQVDQQNRQRQQQQVQQRQKVDQQPKQRQQTEQRQQRTEEKRDQKDNGRDRK